MDLYQHAEAVIWSEKQDGRGSGSGGPCWADHICSKWSRHLISGLISFRASHLISGRRCPSLYSQELISHSPPPPLCCRVMESLWQAVLQACMHWLCDTLHSGVLLKFPSSLPFCSAGRIMSNKKRSKRAETRQEPSLFPRNTSYQGKPWWRYARGIHPGTASGGTNTGPGEGVIAFKWHKRLLSVRCSRVKSTIPTLRCSPPPTACENAPVSRQARQDGKNMHLINAH